MRACGEDLQYRSVCERGGKDRGVRAADREKAGDGQNVKDFECRGAWTTSEDEALEVFNQGVCVIRAAFGRTTGG